MNLKTKVLIVGAGPTGLMLANQLARFGIEFILIDYKSGPTLESRAIAVTARSMEVYQQLDLDKQISSQAIGLQGFKMILNGKLKAQLDMSNFGLGLSDFPNFLTAYEQSKNESLLNSNLENQDIQVSWQHKYLGHAQHNDMFKVDIENIQNGVNKTIEANYLIGCDGASSAVRKSVNLKFEGGTYENKFYVIDADISWKHAYDSIIICPSKEVLAIFFPMKGIKKIRIIGTLPNSFSNQEKIDLSELGLVIKRNTQLDFTIDKVRWYSSYKLHHRCVNSFQKKNVFLAGDSAHIHSPVGGQGMNTGLLDAYNLGWKLAMVINGSLHKNILSSYDEERRPFAKTLLRTTDRAFKFLTGANAWTQLIRNHFIIPSVGTLMKSSLIRKIAFRRISQIYFSYNFSSLSKNYSSQKLKFKAGDRFPYYEKNSYAGYKSSCFHLVLIGDKEAQKNVAKRLCQKLELKLKFIFEPLDHKWKSLGVKRGLLILVRPDLHIACLAEKASEIENYLENLKPNKAHE